ncbi:MAG: TlpA family protein disulfide reductase [Ignavibacteria bacterium]|nr:TlpA family protein disulfide reductase [Ignavibacteria bacterium]MBT8390806.1 TlpA family protein disulfide reductase [Ignavibacteria bacterium]NNJ54085.1 TlpA family protein disulfide reductase [Ignavibacteriaceae bacterium]NNL22657.1 TlpA family protein disulfide reductase [Ignavibacteriaceae bacterium]
MNKICLILLLTGLVFLIKPVYAVIETPAENSIKVEIVSVEDLRKIIENKTGKPLLINVWATWCAPCREEFPDLVRLADEYEDKIDVVGISVDFPEELDSKIIPFLKKQGASFTNYVIKVIEPEDFINLLNKNWSGAVPATFIYDEKGRQVKYLIGKQSFEEFEKAIENQ